MRWEGRSVVEEERKDRTEAVINIRVAEQDSVVDKAD